MNKKTYELTNLEIQYIAGALIEYKNHWDAYSFNPTFTASGTLPRDNNSINLSIFSDTFLITLDNLINMFHEDSQMEKPKQKE